MLYLYSNLTRRLSNGYAEYHGPSVRVDVAPRRDILAAPPDADNASAPAIIYAVSSYLSNTASRCSRYSP